MYNYFAINDCILYAKHYISLEKLKEESKKENLSLSKYKTKNIYDWNLGPISVFVSQISDWVYSFKKIK